MGKTDPLKHALFSNYATQTYFNCSKKTANIKRQKNPTPEDDLCAQQGLQATGNITTKRN
jgi:hypothetical protein